MLTYVCVTLIDIHLYIKAHKGHHQTQMYKVGGQESEFFIGMKETLPHTFLQYNYTSVLKNPSNAAVITDNVKLCAYAVAF